MMKSQWIVALLLGLLSTLPALGQNQERWTLRECLDYAEEENLALQIAQLNLDNQAVVLRRSRAARLPNLNASSNFNANFGYVVNPFTNEFTAGGNQNFNLGLNSGVTLYNGGRLDRTVKQARVDQRVSELDLAQAELDLSLNVTLAYLDVLRNQELVKSAEIQVNSTKRQRDRSAKLVDAGVIPKADLLQIESQIATDELALVNARNQLETTYLNLMQLMQLDLSQPFAVEPVEVEIPPNDIFSTPLNTYYQDGKSYLPFIKSADLAVQSAELNEDIARSGYYPRVTAFASFGTGWASGRSRFSGETATRLDTMGQAISVNGGEFVPGSVVFQAEQSLRESYPFRAQIRDNISTAVGVSLSIPIYSRYQNHAAVQQAQIQRQQAELRAQQSRQQLEQDIQAAYVQARSAYGTYTSTLRQIEALELTLANTEKQFNLGVVNSLDYIVAKNNLERARNDLVQSKYNYIFRVKVLDFYRGRPIGFGN